MRIKSLALVFSISLLVLMACKGGTDSNEMKALQQQMAEQKRLLEGIKSDVEGIKKVIETGRRAPVQDTERTVSIDDDYIRGRPEAKLTLIEFSDFQCPFCERFYRETLPQIEREYISTGMVRMVYRDFPIDNIHKDAQKAAEAAQCAGEQDKYWNMHDKLFDNQKALGVNNLKKYARELPLSTVRFDDCLNSGKYAEEIQKDLTDGQEAGVEGTPTFFLGITNKDKTIQGKPIRGAMPYNNFKQAIDKLLAEK